MPVIQFPVLSCRWVAVAALGHAPKHQLCLRAPHAVSCSLVLCFAHQASEVEETLKRIQSHRGVEGILIVNNDGVPLKSTLSAEQTTQYSSLFSQLSSKARSVVRTLDATVRARLACVMDVCPPSPHPCGVAVCVALLQNDLTFLRVRSKKHEIMVAPDKDYLLIVIQNPNADEKHV